MKLVQIGPPGEEAPAVAVGGDQVIEVADLVSSFGASFFEDGGAELLNEAVSTREPVPLGGRRLGPPIARPHQILCIGLNYADHAAEGGQDVPTEPVVFMKSPNTICGAFDGVRIPRGSTKTDWEVELGIVIGSRTSYLPSVESARHVIAGFCVVNDVSEREFQLDRGGQWSKGKSAETFNPCGPWLVTPDDIPDVANLTLWLDVNGEQRQRATTAKMIFDPYYLVYYLSQYFVLEPGDLINTGTPAGVGLGAKPPTFLRPGDVIECGISGLGSQRQVVLPPR